MNELFRTPDHKFRFIIKFVSADGLVRFEERVADKRPDEFIIRTGTYSKIYEATASDKLPDPVICTRRQYRLFEHGINPETGQYIFEYREAL